mmetsp:Transcript_23206/g.66986  ORF Transcript_23206/g.66986 Transcript_23206/m.66986 type:complete len:227 (-) Transcript_23206:1431-2111(-)
MEPPALLLQLLRRQVLLICALGVVEDEKQTVNAGLFVEGWIVEGRRRNRRIRRGGRVRVLRLVRALPLGLIGTRHIEEGILQATEVASIGIGTSANSGTAGLTRSNGRGRCTTGACTTQRKTAEAGSRSQKTAESSCTTATGGRRLLLLLLSLELSRLLLLKELLLLLRRRCRRLLLFSLLLLGLLSLEELGLLLLSLLLRLELLLLLQLLLPQELGLLLGLLFLE